MKPFSIFLVLLILSSFVAPTWASIVVSNQTPIQGETIEVTYKKKRIKVTEKEKDGSAQTDVLVFNEHSFKLFPVSVASSAEESETYPASNIETYHCLVAVPADLRTGKYPISVNGEQSAINVKEGVFPVQHLTLPKSKDNFLMSPGEEEAMDAAKSVLSDTRLWKGSFAKPCQARTSAKFGLKRIVNGKLLKDYYHSGLDFAGALGQPVYACAGGKVVLARHNFKLHGNVVAIDHGQGVVSIYIHLQKIKVKEGDVVTACEQIGNVGATGRANGPHLHLSLYVNKVATNPMPWFSKTF